MRFDKYKGDISKFNEFNKLCFNMPRHSFSNMSVELVIEISKLMLIIIENNKFSGKISYKNYYYYFHMYVKDYPDSFLSQTIGKERMFDLQKDTKIDIMNQYSKTPRGRMFRHIMELCKLWGLLDKESKVVEETCLEFSLITAENSHSIRTRYLDFEIFSNYHTSEVGTVKLYLDYHQSFELKLTDLIIKYMNDIGRHVSKFEISNLLGVLLQDDLSQEGIYNEAITLGKQFPTNLKQHKDFFFDYMEWNDNGTRYVYKSSQAPTFKFNSYIILLESANIIQKDIYDGYHLSENIIELLAEDIPYEIVELERYLDIAEQSESDRELVDLILANTNPNLLKYLAKDDGFIKVMSLRALNNMKHDSKGKKKRNRLIAELAKIRVDYICQVTNKPTFKNKKGNYYVESHHLIEFNGENGPDVVENLFVLGPLYHKLIHNGSTEVVRDFYQHIRMNNIVTLDTFKDIHDKYECITDYHINCLNKKGLISTIESQELTNYII